MNNVDKISKEAKMVLDSTRDNLVSGLINASRNGQIQIEASELPRLVQVVNFIFDDSAQKAMPYFQNSIKKLV